MPLKFRANINKMGDRYIISMPRAFREMIQDMRGKKVLITIEEVDEKDYNTLPPVR